VGVCLLLSNISYIGFGNITWKGDSSCGNGGDVATVETEGSTRARLINQMAKGRERTVTHSNGDNTYGWLLW
jgi:hypothetical protein